MINQSAVISYLQTLKEEEIEKAYKLEEESYHEADEHYLNADNLDLVIEYLKERMIRG